MGAKVTGDGATLGLEVVLGVAPPLEVVQVLVGWPQVERNAAGGADGSGTLEQVLNQVQQLEQRCQQAVPGLPGYCY